MNATPQYFHIKAASSSNTKAGQISQESLKHSANNIGKNSLLTTDYMPM